MARGGLSSRKSLPRQTTSPGREGRGEHLNEVYHPSQLSFDWTATPRRRPAKAARSTIPSGVVRKTGAIPISPTKSHYHQPPTVGISRSSLCNAVLLEGTSRIMYKTISMLLYICARDMTQPFLLPWIPSTHNHDTTPCYSPSSFMIFLRQSNAPWYCHSDLGFSDCICSRRRTVSNG